jgi:hypothetical protein
MLKHPIPRRPLRPAVEFCVLFISRLTDKKTIDAAALAYKLLRPHCYWDCFFKLEITAAAPQMLKACALVLNKVNDPIFFRHAPPWN